MSLESKIENQPFAVRRVVLASGWRQGLTSLFNSVNDDGQTCIKKYAFLTLCIILYIQRCVLYGILPEIR